MAQLVAQFTCNEKVAGSTPAIGTKGYKPTGHGDSPESVACPRYKTMGNPDA